MFFQEFYREKPLSSKQESSELFYVGKKFKKVYLRDIMKNPKIISSFEDKI